MTPEEIKKKVLEFKWEPWFDRPFGTFTMSVFMHGMTRKFMKKLGVDAEWPAILFQNGHWYKSEEVWDIFEKELQLYLEKGGEVSSVVKKCEDYLNFGKKRIDEIFRSKVTSKDKLKDLYEVLTQVVSWIWLAHGFEHLYVKILQREVPKYMEGDVEKNIGDISYPEKKNAHYYFEKDLKSDLPIEKVHKKFAWIKARGGFDDGFTLEELKQERQRLLQNKSEDSKFVRPEIPVELEGVAKIAQDLVYLRTLRTDVLYELMYYARPLMTEIAKHFGLTFQELRDYSALDLMEGKLEKYEYHKFTAISFGENFAFFHGSILESKKQEVVTELKGTVAFKGVVRGKAKIVMIAHEIGKVEEGDILVAPTTAPSYIPGMKKAVGFIADEGGITSHTAIVAREMKKPCIIGTKIATKVLKDGDLVEVDAERGIVTIIERKK